ncbi:MAG: DUF4174 domain-containing protein [Woeseiaceae bacterium]|nr:DUF4174 domain-containing protein [Woeseiaceae bacterium]
MKASLLIVGGILMTLCAPPTSASDFHAEAGLLLTEFTTERADFDWYVVNDNVMGGRSEGTFRIEQGELDFAGSTNTRGGGFSSIRTKPVELDLSEFAGIRLQARGDGRRYTWRLTTNARWRGRQVSYWGDFDTQDGVWMTVDIPFSRFVPQFQGIRLDGPELDPGQITGMGLMIYDKLDGPFELRLASVRAYSAQAPFALEHYRWKNRILVVSARTRDDVKLAELQTKLASTPEEFADRDMVLVTLLDYGTSMVGDQELTAAEAAATRDALGIQTGSFALRLIGKDGSVKLSTESATPIKEIFALIDTMPMRKRENPDR